MRPDYVLKKGSVERSESKKRAPGAKNFKSYLWRPLTAVSVVVASQAFTDGQFTPQVSHLSMPVAIEQTKDTELSQRPLSPAQEHRQKLELEVKSHDSAILLAHQSMYLDSAQTQKPIHRTDCDDIFGTVYQNEKEREHFLKNCNSPEQVKDRIKKWLIEAGWPEELLDQAVEVSYGCESGGDPTVISDNGLWKGLFQLGDEWFTYAGEDPERWKDPITNARVAYKVFLYDIEKGQEPWTQWGCKPTALTTT